MKQLAKTNAIYQDLHCLAAFGFSVSHGKVIEKTLPGHSRLKWRVVLGIVPFGGAEGTII
jgi:hypothetical protein